MPLASAAFLPKKAPSSARAPIFILHGLFGSKQNWRSLSKSMFIILGTHVYLTIVGLAERMQTTVYALDLPNHGESAWSSDRMDYPHLSHQVSTFIQRTHPAGSFDLIGHSMVIISNSHLSQTEFLDRALKWP
jgi:pimeloyl-ACP methyl ester carboxylesterase